MTGALLSCSVERALAALFRAAVMGLAIYGGLDLMRGVMAQDESVYLPSVAQAAQVQSLETRVAALEYKLQNVTANADAITVTGANLWVVSGSGATDGITNGLGNVIVGYNERRGDGADARTGSHMVVVGRANNYTTFGGIVVGRWNTTSGPYSTVSGGTKNVASGADASVSGGYDNQAFGSQASVSGGRANVAHGADTSISGGQSGWASGEASSVTGGFENSADGGWASVSGGAENSADGYSSSICGGYSNRTSEQFATVTGGWANEAHGYFSSVTGGCGNTATGEAASVSGGRLNEASGYAASVSGGRNRQAEAGFSWRAGDLFQPN